MLLLSNQRTIKLAHTPEEWFSQAEYDFQTAQAMVSTGHGMYAVFMAHLAIEKALKGIYHKKSGTLPPRTHSLLALLRLNELTPSAEVGEFMGDLDQASVATRYPEELVKLQAAYPRPVVEKILMQTKEALVWARKMF
jgi:HEPN domain-containing protein